MDRIPEAFAKLLSDLFCDTEYIAGCTHFHDLPIVWTISPWPHLLVIAVN